MLQDALRKALAPSGFEVPEKPSTAEGGGGDVPIAGSIYVSHTGSKRLTLDINNPKASRPWMVVNVCGSTAKMVARTTRGQWGGSSVQSALDEPCLDKPGRWVTANLKNCPLEDLPINAWQTTCCVGVISPELTAVRDRIQSLSPR